MLIFCSWSSQTASLPRWKGLACVWMWPTALNFAAQEGQDKVVEMLIEHRADVDAINDQDWTSLFMASKRQKI